MTEPVQRAMIETTSVGNIAPISLSAAHSQDRGSGRQLEILTSLFCSALCVISTSLFLPHQALWIDEIDQLGGLTLGPRDVVSWLAGWTQHDFLMSVDTSPPLSYWVGWLWSRVFGLGEIQLRWLGVTCVALSTLIVFWTAREAWGLASGFAAGLLFALSPNVIMMGVEIRPYPLYLLMSAATFWCFTRMLQDPKAYQTGWAIGLLACSLCAIYTHFFGLALSGSCVLSALIVVGSRGGRLGPLVIAASLIAVASLGILPFVASSFKIYKIGEATALPAALPSGKADDLLRLLWRLFAAPPTSLSLWAMAAAIVGTALGIVASLAPKQRGNDAAIGLILALGAGLAVVFGARFLLSELNTLASRYNLWMVTAFILVMSSGLAGKPRILRTFALLGGFLLIAASAYSTIALAVHGEYFAHNSHRQIKATILRLGVDRVGVIHESPVGDYYDIYISLRHALGPELRQYSSDNSDSGDMRVVELPDKRTSTDLAALNQDYLVVLNSRRLKSREIVNHLRTGYSPEDQGYLSRSLASSGDWVEVERKLMVSSLAARMSVFKRVSHDRQKRSDSSPARE